MRFARLAAFALWVMVALLAVAGFAAFSPETATITTTSSTVAAPAPAGADWGLTSGRVMALAFSSGLRSAPDPTDPSIEDALILDLLGERPEVTTTTTTTTLLRSTTTTAASATTAAARPDNGNITETEARSIISLFFAPEDVELALEVARCESHWDPGATNPSSRAAGLFQQIPRFWAERAAAAGWAGADIYDSHANTAVSAWLVYEGGGWIHWAESQGCWG